MARVGQAGPLSKRNLKPSKKGTDFEQPLAAHQRWHPMCRIPTSAGRSITCSVLDGCSRYTVKWDLSESMTEADIEIILEGTKERHP